MNPDADMDTAIANNYDVKYFEKKAGNLTSQYLIDSNQAQIQDAKDKAAKSLRNQYNAVLTGRDSLNAAVMALDVASVNLNTATAKRAVGEITELEYQNVLNSYISAKNSVETDKLQLLLAMEAYDWNVKGLTTSKLGRLKKGKEVEQMNINRRKGFMALSLAAVMAVGGTGAALADEPGVVPGDTYTEAMARLQDSHMEYDELTDLIKNCYAPIKSAYSMIDTMEEDQGSIATAMRVVADDYMSQGRPGWQMFWAAVILRVMQVVGGARMLRSSAGSMDRSIERSKSSRSVDRQVNMIVSGAETLMNQYEYYLAQRTVVAKALEIAQTAQAIQQTMQAQGLAVDADVLSAAAQLSSAKSPAGEYRCGN